MELERFSVNEWVNYPPYGVGLIKERTSISVKNAHYEVLCIEFQDPYLVLKVPVEKEEKNGLRKICSQDYMKKALQILKEKGKYLRTLWSQRAAIYEKKIQSGNVCSIAEVIRDLKDKSYEEEQSYSERSLFKEATQRLCRELSIISKTDITTAHKKIKKLISK